ncbi:GNAT family N-acetyltransferase/peptidase C39 family protein [Motiliproteus sediminis]|uniref:GNAT family N-acetyltransferase/peptidase C39 family protein n=1 Tax=Motiliproteus sediminis TaxID=1468178 RepID=UPI001AEFD6C2|nr:GNAT family N-acetyltransferase/peptidase C39 family protein [Motiliproteus sediminis]
MSLPARSVLLRAADHDDLDALVELENACFDGDRLSRRSFRHLLRGRHSQCLVATSEGQVVGYILLLFRRGSSLARVYSLATAPAWRGSGIGRQLLQAAESVARERRCLFVRLEVREDNPAALALYRAKGYKLFDTEPDYYDDGATALRLEKALAHTPPQPHQRQLFYRQSTPFTCGPASLMMAMASLDADSCSLDTRTEIQLWREATTIFMTAGHGGCSPEGLALSAWQRGFDVTLYRQCHDIPFIEGVRDERKKQVIRLVHDDFIERINASEIQLQDTAITPAQLQQHIAAGDCLITLISTWRLNRNKAPHWVFVAGCDERFVYLNDPDPDEDGHHPFHDSIHLPVSHQEFERMACFGSQKLKATLVLRPAGGETLADAGNIVE